MAEAFIVEKTNKNIFIIFGGIITGIFEDAFINIKKGEKFFNLTFEELQKLDIGKINFKED